jgi:hypothetical protein
LLSPCQVAFEWKKQPEQKRYPLILIVDEFLWEHFLVLVGERELLIEKSCPILAFFVRKRSRRERGTAELNSRAWVWYFHLIAA